MLQEDNIIALATAPGIGAIAVIRISGPQAISIISKKFTPIGKKKLEECKSHTIHLGHIVDDNTTLDKVLVSIFKGPNSYTGENVAEISCHGSPYIQQQIIQLFLRNDCRMATPGEFTLRAFLNGKMDLSQAEAVADLIASDSAASHQVAMQQMRGGFGHEIQNLREELLNFASLIELELDFSGEDVEFADRAQFKELLTKITDVLERLIDSFALGNVIKNGIPVAIVGEPNVGKSTLLNALLNEERAIVSSIAGTTRDTVEDQISIEGVNFRFIDTAGLRETTDHVEKIGIAKSYEKIEQAALILNLTDATKDNQEEIKGLGRKYPDKKIVVVANKIDKVTEAKYTQLKKQNENTVFISAKQHEGIAQLKKILVDLTFAGELGKNDTVITNNRHYDSLLKALGSIQKVKESIQEELASDLMAIDIREALLHLGEITGSVTTDDLLGNIFSNFCIGK
ncbi:MAG: tRNA uridine-5-carboxymethylaminomethyl(34) synthesis GTPase MnmE [Croceivirga sp.]